MVHVTHSYRNDIAPTRDWAEFNLYNLQGNIELIKFSIKTNITCACIINSDF